MVHVVPFGAAEQKGGYHSTMSKEGEKITIHSWLKLRMTHLHDCIEPKYRRVTTLERGPQLDKL